jgi:DNA replication licensing factor MCM5
MQKIDASNTPDVDMEFLRKYLCYAKMKVYPRLSEEAGHMLQDMYVGDRQASKEQNISKKTNGIPITVRQLEAIIRLSESIAKMHLQPIVLPQHVEEAHRLFRISTLNAAASGMSNTSGKQVPQEMVGLV